MIEQQETSIVVMAFILLNALLDGWALALLCKWFVVKTFDIKPIPIASAIGIGLIFSLLAFIVSLSNLNLLITCLKL